MKGIAKICDDGGEARGGARLDAPPSWSFLHTIVTRRGHEGEYHDSEIIPMDRLGPRLGVGDRAFVAAPIRREGERTRREAGRRGLWFDGQSGSRRRPGVASTVSGGFTVAGLDQERMDSGSTVVLGSLTPWLLVPPLRRADRSAAGTICARAGRQIAEDADGGKGYFGTKTQPHLRSLNWGWCHL